MSSQGLLTRGLIDTHAHLCDAQFSQDRRAVIERAGQKGIRTIVEIADSPEGWDCARDLAASFSVPSSGMEIYWSCGFHPHHADGQDGFDFGIMRKAAVQDRCVALGEIGLDYVKSQAPKEVQISLFRSTLEIAADLGKPVVIHCRESQADTLRILKSFFGGLARSEDRTGVIHCFSGDLHFAEGCLDLGFYIGIDGPITYPSARQLREVISKVPLDRIVLETDSPYLPPQDHRGKRNESAYLPLIAERVAELSGKGLEEISMATSANAARLFELGRT